MLPANLGKQLWVEAFQVSVLHYSTDTVEPLLSINTTSSRKTSYSPKALPKPEREDFMKLTWRHLHNLSFCWLSLTFMAL